MKISKLSQVKPRDTGSIRIIDQLILGDDDKCVQTAKQKPQ